MTIPKIVVLTGGIGSGKTTVSVIFKKFNINVIDTDLISSKLTGKNGNALESLRESFDPKFFNVDGSLNKKLIRYEIFSNSSAKLKIESILHPMISKEVETETRAAKSSYVLQVIPLWVEKNKHLRPNIWKLVVVDCSESIQKYRATNRSKIDAFTFNKIKLNQAARSSRIELADYVIDNNGTIDTLEPQVSKIHNLLLNNV
mgnify:FL=1